MRDDEPDRGSASYLFRTIAAFIILIAALSLIAIDVLDQVLFKVNVDIGVYGWALLVTAVYVLFGFSLPDLLEGRRRRKKDDDDDE